MNDANPPALDLSKLPGIFIPDATAEPRPPFQVRRGTQIYFAGRAPPDIASHALPRGLKRHPNGFFILGIHDVPEGWGLAPFRGFHLGFEVEGYEGADGSPAVYQVAGTFSGKAGDILPRDYNTLFHKGEVEFALAGTDMSGAAPLDGGEGRIAVTARRVFEAPISNAGVVHQLGPAAGQGMTLHSVAFSFSFTSLADMRIEVDLPEGHRLDYIRELRPDWGLCMTDLAFTMGPPQPAEEIFDDTSSRMAFLDALTRIGRAVVIVEQTGRVAFLTREAQAMLKDDTGTALTRLPAAVTRSALASPLEPLRQPALVTLSSGRQLAARAFPIALRLGTGPLSMVLLTDPRAPGPTDPEPLLRLMGLTPSEAGLAALVGQGLSPSEAAARRGITPSTARSVLKAVFSKLGLRRQTDLAILVTRLGDA